MERKKKKTYLVVLWTITLVIVVGACLLRFTGVAGGKGVLEVVDFDGQEVSEIALDVDAGKVEIKYGPIFQVEYRYPKKFAPKVELNKGKLTVKQSMTSWNFNGLFGNNNNYEMAITIPKGTELTSLDSAIDLGELEIEGIVASSLTVQNDCGDIKIHNCDGKNLNITSDLGDIDIDNCNYSSVVAQSDLGDVDLFGDFDTIDAKVDLGEIDIKTDKPTDEVTIKASCELGDVTVNGEDW